MKTYRALYPKLCEWDNLYLAYRKARKGKRGRVPAATFEFNLESNLVNLQRELIEKRYMPGSYHSFYIHEPKRRLISAAPFRDRVVHHALCNVIEPIFERCFIHDSYANRVGKGTHRAVNRAQQFARHYDYVLQLDLRQFFASIDHVILKEILTRKVADADVLALIDQILNSGAGILAREYEMQWFPGDDLLAVGRSRGLPIGNLTSQFWANCYLNPLDHFIKRQLRCRGYVRYVDDLLLFSADKKQLWDWRRQVIGELANLRLVSHPGAQPRPVGEGFPFLGFVIYPDHRRLKRRKVVQVRRRLNQRRTAYLGGKLTQDEVSASVRGWINHARYADSWGLRKAVLKDIVL